MKCDFRVERLDSPGTEMKPSHTRVFWGSLQSALCLALATQHKGQYSLLSSFALGLWPPEGKIVTHTQGNGLS